MMYMHVFSGCQVPRFPKRFGPLLKEDNYWLILLTAPKSLLPAQLFPQSLKLLHSTTYWIAPTKCSRHRSNLSCPISLVNSHSKPPTSAQILQFSSSNTNHLVIQARSIKLNFSSFFYHSLLIQSSSATNIRAKILPQYAHSLSP